MASFSNHECYSCGYFISGRRSNWCGWVSLYSGGEKTTHSPTLTSTLNKEVTYVINIILLRISSPHRFRMSKCWAMCVYSSYILIMFNEHNVIMSYSPGPTGGKCQLLFHSQSQCWAGGEMALSREWRTGGCYWLGTDPIFRDQC